MDSGDISKSCCFDERQCRPCSDCSFSLTFSTLQTNTDIFANSADPDATSRFIRIYIVREFAIVLFFTQTPNCNNGCVQMQIWKSLFEKLRGERVDMGLYCLLKQVRLII